MVIGLGVFAIFALALPANGPAIAVAFVSGALCSIVSGFISMKSATRANVRTTWAAHLSGQKHALNIAYLGGSVIGLAVASICFIGISVFLSIFTKAADVGSIVATIIIAAAYFLVIRMTGITGPFWAILSGNPGPFFSLCIRSTHHRHKSYRSRCGYRAVHRGLHSISGCFHHHELCWQSSFQDRRGGAAAVPRNQGADGGHSPTGFYTVYKDSHFNGPA